jgi:hypothetical protein
MLSATTLCPLAPTIDDVADAARVGTHIEETHT